MPTRRYGLLPEIQQQICAFIRAGAYRRVAARAAGIPPDVFENWLRLGRGLEARHVYRNLVDAVEEAEAQARAVAEVEAFKSNPLAWLKFGPGKERAGTPGWSGLAKALKDGDLQAGLRIPLIMQLLAVILEVLNPSPEDRDKVIEAVNKLLAERVKVQQSAVGRQGQGPVARRTPQESDGNPTGTRPESDGNLTGTSRNPTGTSGETFGEEQKNP